MEIYSPKIKQIQKETFPTLILTKNKNKTKQKKKIKKTLNIINNGLFQLSKKQFHQGSE